MDLIGIRLCIIEQIMQCIGRNDEYQYIDDLRIAFKLHDVTFDNLSNTNVLIAQICQRQGQDFGCVEEAAYQNNLVSKQTLKSIIKHYPNNSYKQYIEEVLF